MESIHRIPLDKKVGIFIVDERQVYLEEMLVEMGYKTCAWDYREGTHPASEEEIWKSQIMILPVPVKKLGNLSVVMDEMARREHEIELCIGGVFTDAFVAFLEEHHIPYLDVLAKPEVATKNAIATAEGTVAELCKLMPVNVEGARVIVMGFGKCAMPIAEKLYCMGAEISVVARSEKALSLAHYYGYMDYPMDAEIPYEEVDAIVNTIPALVITKNEIDKLKKDAVVLDIASAPGGCDGAYCKEKGIPYKLALGLPGLYAPKSSAEILLEAMPFGYKLVENKWKS